MGFFAEDRLTQKVHFWLNIVAKYIPITLNLNVMFSPKMIEFMLIMIQRVV